MYSYKSKKLPKNTVEIIVTVPKEDIAEGKKAAFAKLQANLTVEGFRKGKVPEAIAAKHLKDEQLYQETIQMILPKMYEEILKKDSLKPIVSPKIELVKAKAGEDWEIKLALAEKPEIDLGKYKEAIKEAKNAHKKEDIWVPGKDQKNKPDPEMEKSHMINHVLEALLKAAKVEIADMIVEDELNHRLSRMVDDVQKIGLTMEQYLKSKNLTMESVKEQFKREIEDTYKLEFLLSEVADKEGIKVEKEELDKLFANIKDDKEKQMALQNSYYYATILRKQKTIDFLVAV
ncbi:MAG: trigger factor [Patescibacteria group bacterium]